MDQDWALTILALWHIRVATERAHERHNVRKQLIRNSRWEGQGLLNALSPI